MNKEKILREHYQLCVYSEKQMELLETKRKRAIELLEIFTKAGIAPYIYGSIARGDVHEDSDIDLIFLQLISPFQIEYLLNKNGITSYFREIIMATPNDSLKLYIYLSELESITIPLSKMDTTSLEFYDFGGKLSLNDLKNHLRIPGVDKRLVMIKPNHEGHEEYSIIGNELKAAKELKISLNTVNERISVLLKREKHGKTGVFLKKAIAFQESTEEVLKRLSNKKPIVRKKLYKK
ncbi:MAG: nucleotidyltransferase domain-containing protein [Promethearchaeota archaeon]